MHRMPRALTILVLTLLAGISLPAATAQAKMYVYNAVISAKQETPLNATTGSGGGYFVIDTDANTVNFWISFAGLSAAENAAHIHGFSGPGVPAGVVFTLPAGNPKVGTWNYAEGQEASILGGLCYVNIHTTANPGGEIRGQIVPLNAIVDGAQETPPVATAAAGWMTATIDTTANTISYYMAYSGLSGAVTAAHFHGNANYTQGPAGVKVGLTVTASPMTGTVGYSQVDEGAILAGRWYVNLHTGVNPGGEIRGQLSPRVVPMDPLQENPINLTASSGYALCAVDTAANTLGYDVHITQLSGAEIAAHIHGPAALGANAGVLQTLAIAARKLGTWNYTAANEADVLLGRTYFNSHTGANPGGEIRGQILFLPGAEALLNVGGPSFPAHGISAAPNPFLRRTTLTFSLTRTGTVSLAIMSVDGRRVRSVEPTTFAPGPHTLEWDGLDDAGRTVAPGVYFAVVHLPDGVITTRLARLN
ncbi:MAG TPA: CHRD domain-containing protein [Methylomirabilota bacterium]|nr:CHRD domain-containing protein [Methylomirabilota bacterium]